MLRSALLISPVLLAVGCSCNQDYTFPPLDRPAEPGPPTDYGSWLSMDTAPDGVRLTMTYYDREQTGIGFAVGTPQSDGSVEWKHERVDGYPEADGLDRGDRGKYTSHRVAPDGKVYAAYQDSQNGTLRVGVREGTANWVVETVDAGTGITSSGAGAWASLALMSNGLPMVAHHDDASGTLRVAMLTEGGWQTEEAWAGTNDVGAYANLYIHEDTAYIAFYDAVNGNLELLEGTFGSWTHSVVDTPGDVGQWPSVWADADEVLIAYHDVSNQDLKLARRANGNWSTQTVDDGEYRGADTELFFLNGQPAIVYFDGQNNDMWLATTDGSSWSRSKIGGDAGAVGFHNEVAVANGVVYAGSYDFTARTMFLAVLADQGL
ncbi:MAG: hypothetical protein H6737_16090 [Alphaproteobacteria bacterium]|nr:hypothetical protein [Alphaproteobacteria bacterium]